MSDYIDDRLRSIVFPIEGIKPLIDHAKASKDWRMGYGSGSKKKPALLLVKDQGCYLLSNGLPIQLKDPANKKGGLVVHYAEGLGKDCDHIGGDDFVECVDIGAFEKAIEVGAKAVKVRLTARTISITPVMPQGSGRQRTAKR